MFGGNDKVTGFLARPTIRGSGTRSLQWNETTPVGVKPRLATTT